MSDNEENIRSEVARERLRGAERSLPKGSPPALVRQAHGWGMMLDAVRPTPARHPDVFKTVNGKLYLAVSCRGLMVRDPQGVARHKKCENGALLPVPDEGLSPIAVRVVALWMCEECSARDDEMTARRDASRDLDNRVREAGIPPALAAAVSWDTMTEKALTEADTKARIKAIQACKEWASKGKPAAAVLLYGDAGTGKTRLAATAAMARLEHSPIKWVSVAVLMAKLQAAWSDDDRKIALRVLTGKGPVVLDDLDKINPTPNVLAQLFTAIDIREQAGERAVLITTNQKPSDLAVMLGDVLMSRLSGMTNGGALMLPFPGPDRRLEMHVDEETGEAVDAGDFYANRGVIR